jgi:hypothetical protein
MSKKQKYDIIYSLGSDCACALYLNKNNLRSTSGPFDWVSNMSFNNRVQLILNDFKDYLKLSDLKNITPNDRVHNTKYEVYINNKLECIFPHDFAIDIPFDKSYNEVLKKYQRRIDRFYNNINQKPKVLLIWFSLNSVLSNQDILVANDKLYNKFNKNIDLLIIEHNDDLLNKKMQINKLTENITKINLFAKNQKHTTAFSKGNIKLCNKIFKMYSLNKPCFEKIKFIFLKTICNIIPIKKTRKKIRNLLLYGGN